jgi:acyl-CoA thioesterase I
MRRFWHAILICALVVSVLPGTSRANVLQEDHELWYVALGASDALGIGAFPITQGYVYRIKDALEAQGLDANLLDSGLPGAQIDLIKQVVNYGVPAIGAMGHKIDLVTLWTGANDIIAGADPQEFEDDLEEILSRLREQTSAFVVMGNVPNLTLLPRFIKEPSENVTIERILAFNDIIEHVGHDLDVPVINFFEQIPTDALVSDIDGFHPSNRGHARIAQQFLQLILPEFGFGTVTAAI